MKMPTIVGICIFMSKENNFTGLFEPKKKLKFFIFLYLLAFKSSCTAEVSIKNFYNLGPGPEVIEEFSSSTQLSMKI